MRFYRKAGQVDSTDFIAEFVWWATACFYNATRTTSRKSACLPWDASQSSVVDVPCSETHRCLFWLMSLFIFYIRPTLIFFLAFSFVQICLHVLIYVSSFILSYSQSASECVMRVFKFLKLVSTQSGWMSQPLLLIDGECVCSRLPPTTFYLNKDNASFAGRDGDQLPLRGKDKPFIGLQHLVKGLTYMSDREGGPSSSFCIFSAIFSTEVVVEIDCSLVGLCVRKGPTGRGAFNSIATFPFSRRDPPYAFCFETTL